DAIHALQKYVIPEKPATTTTASEVTGSLAVSTTRTYCTDYPGCYDMTLTFKPPQTTSNFQLPSGYTIGIIGPSTPTGYGCTTQGTPNSVSCPWNPDDGKTPETVTVEFGIK